MPIPSRIPAGLRVPFLLVWGVMASSCADDPRIARRATAIDLAGTWVEVRDDEPPAALVTIANEADINDVVVTITGRVVGATEGALIDRVVADDTRLALRTTLVLGAGRDAVREEADGGENVSFDLGETSTLEVVSAPVAITPSSPTTTSAQLTWSLRLVGTADELDGALKTHTTERQVRPGDVDGSAQVTTTSSVDLRLAR